MQFPVIWRWEVYIKPEDQAIKLLKLSDNNDFYIQIMKKC